MTVLKCDKMRAYISGKISGLPTGEVYGKFAKAEKLLIERGYEPVSPLDNGLPYDFPWEVHIAVNTVTLMGCDAIYLLRDWIFSEGAMLEKKVAEQAGKKIIYQENTPNINVVQAIADVMDISFTEIESKDNRHRKYVYARMIFSHHCNLRGDCRLKDIARIVNRSHCSIIYYLRKYDEEMRFNPKFRELAARVESRLGELNSSVNPYNS